MKTSAIKANGIHYTPPELAAFLASVTAEQVARGQKPLQVLDPACGDGALLMAISHCLPKKVRSKLVLVGYDTNPLAIEQAGQLLSQLPVGDVILKEQDFLGIAGPAATPLGLLDSGDQLIEPRFDVVISNPPYVRTQVLGSARAQALARQFGLTGRVDLYHAFAQAMARVLRPGGTLGLLTSNRFLTIKSGAALRRLLSTQFALRAIYDLGDTKLFSAAVLPVIVVAKKADQAADSRCRFDRVYEQRSKSGAEIRRAPSVLEAVRDLALSGLVRTPTGIFSIERGFLSGGGDKNEVWTLATQDSQDWLAQVDRNRHHTFDDVAKIRVGIKTTADEVFIRASWGDLPLADQPEHELVRPLIRHFNATPWIGSGEYQQTVLYPHFAVHGKRQPIRLANFPRARRYLESHRARLTRRHYLIEAGRRWYEIWVPHNPDDWSKPKIVFPDIAEEPKFFLDTSGAVVNGDCYWMTLRQGFEPDHLLLMLAVANSSFITRYYDVVFHNKLYAGRRRFMAQYVKRFPLPDAKSKAASRAIECVRERIRSSAVVPDLEASIDALVWQAFGLAKQADE